MAPEECYFNIPVLLISTTVSFLSVHSTIVEKPVFKWLSKQTGREQELQQQKLALKNEQSLLSMVDEFAKYSKLQRRINVIDRELEQIKGEKPTNSFVLQLGFTYGVKLVFALLLIVLSLYYRYTPVLYLGDKVNLMPFTNFICYPNEANYVSFYFWVMCCVTVARLI
ncbi:guided entry of tail-anchored proteins factor 1-like [Tribolium madens]|uniref:guided entry of tail-anchored proteins factor 1-like n=1 Tax=Tribolium madens TaxID=41895 RepID=UPI001CF7283B|nr:guided entry of tail-anchored proteins factor 1-like [Tribolium madens]